MEAIVAIVVIIAIIWFGLGTLQARKQERGLDTTDRVHQREHQAKMSPDRPVQDPVQRRPDMPTSTEGQDLLVADYLVWLAERTDEQFDAVMTQSSARERLLRHLDAAVEMGLITSDDARSLAAGERVDLDLAAIRQATLPIVAEPTRTRSNEEHPGSG